MDRRTFLARTGVLGAALAASPALAMAPAPLRTGATRTGLVDQLVGPGEQALLPVLRELASDTFAGLAAFVCPGPDPYSVQQGEVHDAPGGVAADGHGFLAHALDTYLPYPDAILRPLAHALAEQAPVALPPALEGVAEDVVRAVDGALTELLANDRTVPASLPAALLLNFCATTVDPSSLAGPFAGAPFANLGMAGKAEVFRFLDEDASSVVATLDHELDEPSRAAVSGLVRFLSAALVHFTAFGVYSEWSVRGEEPGTVTGRPLGWDLTNFTPGEAATADGWDEFRGYWRGRQQNATDAPVFPRSERETTDA